MATLGATFLDLIDVYKATEDGKQIAAVIEILAQSNPILDDAIAVECNMGGIHRHSIRTGLPSVTWGRLYQGIPQSKSVRQQVDDSTGFVEGLSTVDQRLLELAADKAPALRLSEAAGYLEAMNQEAATGMFYHDTASSPEKFKGLAARYSTYSSTGAHNDASRQVINAGGSGSDNTSVWFVTWGENFTHLLYPKGTKAGIDRKDRGAQRVTDADGNAYYVEEEEFRWHLGMAVKDWRYNVRVANIDISDLRAGTVDLYKFMRQGYYRLQSRKVARPGAKISGSVPTAKQAIYCNREILEALDALATNKGSSDNFVRLSRMEIEGQEVLTYRGIPIKETDALLNTESAVPAAA